MRLNHFYTLTLLLAALLAGCDAVVSKKAAPEQSREMKEALAAERLGEVDKAIDLYAEVTALYPKYPLAYLQVAILLHEKKEDFIGAIYNYEKYIRCADARKDAATVAIVANRMSKARQRLTAQCAKDIAAGSASSDVALMSTLNDLNAKIKALEGDKKRLASSNETLRTELIARDNRITRLNLHIQHMTSTSDGSAPPRGSLAGKVQFQTLANEDGTTTAVQTYEVKSGDTLSRIAEIAYGDASKWPRIKKANPDKIKDDRVRPGDVLIIP